MLTGVATEWLRRMDQLRTQALVLFGCMMLSVDFLNPIKLATDVLGIPRHYALYPFAAMWLYLLATQFTDFVYFAIRTFFVNVMSIFFSRIDIIGHSNIPAKGPVIFTGNHANQYIDAIQVMTNCGHKVSFLIAQKSYETPVVGDFARMISCLPIMRPQDAAIKMPADQTITAEGSAVTGVNTQFTKILAAGDKMRFKGDPEQYKVKEVQSDTQLSFVEPVEEFQEKALKGESNFEVLKYVNQKKVYSKVHDALRAGGALGVFPEGGSHDRTDLLPLKVGLAIIAFGSMERDGLNVPVVPIGLNYYRGHRFRGRAVVEFGPPISIRCVEHAMRGCIVTAPNYDTMQMLYMARRLFQKERLSPQAKQDLNRRFAEGYKILISIFAQKGGEAAAAAGAAAGAAAAANGHDEYHCEVEKQRAMEEEAAKYMPADARGLRDDIHAYRAKLSKAGLRDHQVPTIGRISIFRTIYTLLHLLVVGALTLFPSLILNAPVGLIARILAAQERKKALAGSVVKIAGRDVMMSKKVVISIVLVPLLWALYAVLLFTLSPWDASTCAFIILCMPLFSYFAILATESSFVDLRAILPLLYRLRPSMRREMAQLPAERRQLQKRIRAFVKEVGPSLGPVYNDADLKWGQVIEQAKSTAWVQEMAGRAAHAMEPSKYDSPPPTPSAKAKKAN